MRLGTSRRGKRENGEARRENSTERVRSEGGLGTGVETKGASRDCVKTGKEERRGYAFLNADGQRESPV